MAMLWTLARGTVVICRRCTSRHAALRVQDEDVDARRGRGRPRCAAEPVSPEVAPTIGDALAPPRQHMVEQPADQLQRHVLEGQRRALEQLQQPQVVVDLLQRRDRRVAEAAIGAGDHALEVGIRDLAPDEGAHDAQRNLLIGSPRRARMSSGLRRGQVSGT